MKCCGHKPKTCSYINGCSIFYFSAIVQLNTKLEILPTTLKLLCISTFHRMALSEIEKHLNFSYYSLYCARDLIRLIDSRFSICERRRSLPLKVLLFIILVRIIAPPAN